MIQSYRQRYWMFWLLHPILMLWITFSFDQLAFGQELQPDATLGSETSIVNTNAPIDSTPVSLITGGAIRGANLFHSFTQFNVNTGQAVYFDNPSGIEHIITRVTGSSSSSILGTLGVFGGSADLFLLNPNGILFGPNSSLDLKGSFLATTASSYLFPDAEYSAINPSSQILSVNMPVGLEFRGRAGAIVNQSKVADSASRPVGLKVQSGKTLALVGGNVDMQGGLLTAPGGQIEVGSISGYGQVHLGNTWNFGYEDIPSHNFGDINLKSGAFITSLDEDGGNIALYGNNILVSEGSAIGTLVTGAKPGGTISITASGSFILTGNSQVVNSSFGEGASGNIAIKAKRVFLRDDSYIQTSSTSMQTDPDVTVVSSGQSGNVSITTTQMEISGGAYIGASTIGAGEGGNISINSSDYVNIFGISPDTQSRSRLNTSSIGNSSGNAGNIKINSRFLRVADGAQILASSEGVGAAGNIDLHVRSIRLENHSALNAQTNGGSGNITLNANDIILRDNSQISTSAIGTANGGKIQINTGVLLGLENSDIFANAFEGSGGRVEITAKGIFGLKVLTREELEQLLGSNDSTLLNPSQLPSSDITALSQSNPSLNGQVILNTPEVDPSKKLEELPTTVIDPDTLVAQSPCKRGTESEFTRSGRGGLPPTANQDLSHDAAQVGLVDPTSAATTVQTQNQAPTPSAKTNQATEKPIALRQSRTIAPAQGWVYNNKGNIVLVAYNPNVTSQQRLKDNTACTAQ